MKISYNWLKQFLEIEETPEVVANRLTDLGLEVEGIEKIGKPFTDLQQIITARVLECKPHPNADKLKLVYLDCGSEAALQIVCGAPNVATDQMVALAPVGSTITNLKGDTLKIKKAKIRSEESFGMICSEYELGISEDADGIMVLSDECPAGIKLSDWIKFETDAIFEIGLTPNRSDAMSHWGVARDLRAAYQVSGKKKSLITPSTSSFKIDNRTHKIKIKVEDKLAVPRYCGITISGIKIQASPLKLQNRLKAIGITPKNNVVDVTNYIMHELGQPLHAFDVSAIENDTIVVRKAKKGEKITTLDEVERNLTEDDIVICDSKKPLCIAGVYGGLNSGVSESTNSIFIESAYFDSVHIRKTSKYHGLNTDASFRYERGIDPNITDYALKRAVLLVLETAGGEVTSDLEDIYPTKVDDKQVFLPFDTIRRLVGQNIEKDTIKTILSALEIKVLNITESGMGLSIPAYRVDVNRPVDVIEEILRVYGYNKIEFCNKLNASTAPYFIHNIHKFQEVIAAQLCAQGCYEIMNNSLSNPSYIQEYLPELEDQKVEIINPLSSELSAMRVDLLFGGLEAIRFNINRKRNNLKLFEFGNTYLKTNTAYREHKSLGIWMTGNIHDAHWFNSSRAVEVYDMIGLVDALMHKFGVDNYEKNQSSHALMDNCLEATKNGETLYRLGQINTAIQQSFEIEQPVFYADVNLEALYNLVLQVQTKVEPISKFPAVRRDFALLIDEKVHFEDLKRIAFECEPKLIKNIQLFDVYRGKNLPQGKKSYALRFTLLNNKKTMNDKEIDQIMQKLQTEFEEAVKAEIRGA